jgi:hypothetical protein
MTMIERVARAIDPMCFTGCGNNPAAQAVAKGKASEILNTIEQAGFVIVPREPSEAMIDAYFDRCRDMGFTAHINATAAWEAMLSALSETSGGVRL